MANPIAALVKTKAFSTPGSFDTFSSFGVSLNSSLGNNAIGIGRGLLAQIASDAIFPANLAGISGKTRIGMVNGDGTQLDSKYRVSIFSSLSPQAITGYLQDRTRLTVQSSWKEFIPWGSDAFTGAAEFIAQIGGKSLQNVALSRRMWKGTSPIKMKIELRFEAITNAQTEVVEPCKALLKLASPMRVGSADFAGVRDALKGIALGGLAGANVSKLIGSINLNENKDGWFLAPPGPYPFIKNSPMGDNIQINIGEYLIFTPVIISQATVDLDSRIDSRGYPIGANATVDFETYQVMGKQDIDASFVSGTNSNMGIVKRLTANVAGIF